MRCPNILKTTAAMFLCLACLASEAQEKPVYNVPSPDIASLGTYGTVPVSLFTGTPDISVPLYELHVGNYSFPITATYHTATVKPHSQPGIIGLGWSLRTDGYISRTVHGVYDEKQCGKYIHGYYGHAKGMKGMTGERFRRIVSDSTASDGTAHDWYELAPDEFSFDFCGYGGRFYLNEEGGWTVISDTDIKLEFDADGDGFVGCEGLYGRIPKFKEWQYKKENRRYFNKFTLTTPDGCRYEFGGVNATEYSIPYYSRNHSDLIPTTWRLSRIVTPQGHHIDFAYDTSSVTCDIRYVPSSTQLTNWEADKEYLVSYNTGMRGFTGFMVYPANIKSITTPNETVAFDYQRDYGHADHFDKGIPLYWESGVNRHDPYINIMNPQAQFFMLIDADGGGSEGEGRKSVMNALVSKYLRRMAISERYGGNGRSFFFDYKTRSRRLLTSISCREGTPGLIVRDVTGGGMRYTVTETPPNKSFQDMPVWRFTYDETPMPVSYVMGRTDSEGFYSGGTHELTESVGKSLDTEPVLDAALAMTLKTVQWPTGGYTDFKYELNDYTKALAEDHVSVIETGGTCGGLRIAEIRNRDRHDSVTSVKRYRYTDAYGSRNSSGTRRGIPVYGVSYSAPVKDKGTVRLDMLSAGGFFPCVTGQVSPSVGYSSVIEETLDGHGKTLGHVRSSFSNYGTGRTNSRAEYCHNMDNSAGVTPYTSVSPETGKLLKREYYDSGNNLVKKEEYTYKRVRDGSILIPYCQTVFFCVDPYHFLSAQAGCVTRAYTFSYLPVTMSESVRSTGSDTFVTSRREVDYDSTRLIRKERKLLSDGSWASTEYSYPYDDGSLSWMSGRHFVSHVVRKKESRHGEERVAVMDYEANDRSRSTPYASRLTRIRNGMGKVEYQALSADEYGNPRETIENGRHSTLVWFNQGQRLGARLDNYSLASRGRPVLPIREKAYASVDTMAIEGATIPGGNESYDFGQRQYPGSLIHLYAYDGCLRLDSHTDPSLQTECYAHDALGRLRHVYFNERQDGGDSRRATLKRYMYDYYNDDALKGTLRPDAISQAMSNDPVEAPVADSYRPVAPAKGYAATLKLTHWSSGATPDSLRGYLITLADTQTIRFRCVDFQYTRGLGTGMPDGKLPLDVRLYDDTSGNGSPLASFRWYVEGTEKLYADTTAVDTCGLVLSPGTYLLVYGGYKEDVMTAPITKNAMVIQGEQSAITVAMESLPLLPPPGKAEVTGWNTITEFTSRDGSMYGGESVMTQYDDFGRLTKTIARGKSPMGNDIVEARDYDGFGRERRVWLPVASSSDIPMDMLLGDVDFHGNGGDYSDGEPYSYTVYEDSPLSRTLVAYGPGEDWHAKGKGMVTACLANVSGSDTLGCAMLKAVNGGEDVTVRSDGEYATGTLSVTRTEDEDGRASYRFEDRDGRTVLERRVLNEDGMRKTLDTYYVYGAFGNLLAVLPPAASDGIGTGNVDRGLMDAYAYQYRYDNLDRMTAKKLPGRGWVYHAYDVNDNMVFSQDAEQRKQGRSTFVLRDSLGRQCVTGTCSFTFPRGYSVQGEVYCHYTGEGDGLAGYVVTGVTLTDARVLTATYYDSYDFLDDLCRDSKLPKGGLRYGRQAECVTGLVTGRVNSVLEATDSVTPRKLFSVIRYDYRARQARIETENLMGGYDVEDTEHDFLGRVTKRCLTHHVPRPGKDIEEEYAYAYDNAGRLLTVDHAVSGGETRVLADNRYDELGRLAANKPNGSDALATCYDYNLRSWLTKVTNPAFEMLLRYNESDGTAKPLYGGNVSSMEWKAGLDGMTRRYGFTYDGLGWLTAATYGEKDASGERRGQGDGNYDTRYEYDLMGNIVSLRRNGLHDDGTHGEIDNLRYMYDGNKVTRVDDSAIDPVYKDCFTFVDVADGETEYEYDENGNMTKDLNRGICRIGYNCLNLPSEVDFTDGSRIAYAYDGGGRKLRVDYYINPLTASLPQLAGGTGAAGGNALVHTWTSYCANKVYENDTLKMSLFDGGYVSYDVNGDAPSSSPSYHFYVKDHLGDNRLVLGENGETEQVNHYYPFGGLMGGSVNLASSQRYKYNGKELDRTHGLDWYDYGARMYDPALARWMVPDPMAEKYYSASPYAYCHDDPINAIDPDGCNPIFNTRGEYIGMTKEGYTGQIYVYTGMSDLDFASENITFWTKADGEYGAYFKTYDEVERSYTGKAKANFESNVLNNVVSHFNGTKVFNDRTFNTSTLKNGKIGFSFKDKSNFTTLRKHNGIKTQIDAHEDVTSDYEGTVENFAASIIIHEWYSHGEYKIGSVYKNHYKAYQNVMKDKIFYPKTTKKYKEFVKQNYEFYIENKSK